MAMLKSCVFAAFVLGSAVVTGPVDAVVQAGPATSSCLLAFNLARAGKLDERLGTLSQDDAQQGAVVTAITQDNLAGAQAADCGLPANIHPVSANYLGFIYTYPHNEKMDCPAFVQAVLTSALGELSKYDGQVWNNGGAAPYDGNNAQNLAYLMFSNATGVGCGVTTGCTGGNNLLLCRFSPSITQQYTQAPFTAEFFAALKAREEKGVKLQQLTEKDVGTGLTNKGGSSGGAGVAPGVIPVALLTITSLLGFVSFR